MAKKKSRRRPPQKKKETACQAVSEKRLQLAAQSPVERFHKGLQHDPTTGNVKQSHFEFFTDQLKKLNADPGKAAKNGFRLRKTNQDSLRNFVNPQSGWALDTENTDPCCYSIPAPPKIDTEEDAAEIIELYWMALLRDVPFIAWDDTADFQEAAEELSGLRLYINEKFPNDDPATAPFRSLPLDSKTIFRGGELKRFSDPGAGISEGIGPYISQFLLHEIPYGTLRIPQRVIYAAPGIDYMTTWPEWLAVQNGEKRNPRQNLIGEYDACDRRYISTMRDLATYVHFDQLFQAYLNAAIILADAGYPANPGNPYGPGCSMMGIGQDQNPKQQEHYLHASKQSRPKPKYPDQDGFGTFGGPHVLTLVTEVATCALKAVWRQKWTHLRLRPEAYGGLVHRLITDQPAPFNDFSPDVERILKSSEAIKRVADNRSHYDHENALLPMAFPEGSPTHPSYGAGHATVAGACVTVLKAFFDASVQFINPVQASADGQALIPYTGMDAHSGKLTVELELNKLAANISIGRNMAGVHWRSDYTQSVLLGQRVAVDMLYRQSATYTEDYCFTFNSFGGKEITIHDGYVTYAGSRLNLPPKGDLPRGFCLPAEYCEIAKELQKVI